MRLLVRFALAIILCLLLIAAYEYSNIRKYAVSRSNPKADADEVVRILLMSDDPASSWETNVNVTFNVIVVLIISLLSIALLVTGIIVIAVTLDSSVIDNESGDLDEKTVDLRDDQTIWTPQFLSSADRLLPQIGIITNLNKYSVSSINEI
uniref:Col_cuticle_N domain-containing protein n=1 Tax=Elaeophora elaphi TaxID=1147741 RepID=A0A0R3RGB5_9BILA